MQKNNLLIVREKSAWKRELLLHSVWAQRPSAASSPGASAGESDLSGSAHYKEGREQKGGPGTALKDPLDELNWGFLCRIVPWCVLLMVTREKRTASRPSPTFPIHPALPSATFLHWQIAHLVTRAEREDLWSTAGI